MNIAFTSIGSYPWHKDKDLKNIGLLMKFIDPNATSSPAYFHVIDEQLLFLAVIQYGMTFQELTEIELIRLLDTYQSEKRRLIIMGR